MGKRIFELICCVNYFCQKKNLLLIFSWWKKKHLFHVEFFFFLKTSKKNSFTVYSTVMALFHIFKIGMPVFLFWFQRKIKSVLFTCLNCLTLFLFDQRSLCLAMWFDLFDGLMCRLIQNCSLDDSRLEVDCSAFKSWKINLK